MLEHPLSQEEHDQIVQTIEMFEAIIQTQPSDYQSLEILKEAYQKIGRNEDWLRTSRRLSEVYFNVGSYSDALQECELILMKEPNAPEVQAMVREIEGRLRASGEAIANANTGDGSLINIQGGRGARGKHANLLDRGDDHLAKFLIVQQLFGEEQVTHALEAVKEANKDLSGQELAISLLDMLCKDDVTRVETVLSALIDRTKFAYVPLEYYDVDRQIGPMLPDYLTLGRLFVPFDLVSRTLMVACCNPFDAAGRDAVQQKVDYTVAWYLARPGAIAKSLQGVYKLEVRA